MDKEHPYPFKWIRNTSDGFSMTNVLQDAVRFHKD